MRSCVRVGAHSGLCICLFVGLMSAASAQAADLSFIEVDPQSTTALREQGTGRPFLAVGLNYFGPHMGWAPKLWQQFDATTIRPHLDLIKKQGFNTVRVFLTLERFPPRAGPTACRGVERFREFLPCAANASCMSSRRGRIIGRACPIGGVARTPLRTRLSWRRMRNGGRHSRNGSRMSQASWPTIC